MNIEEIRSTIAALNLIKSTVNWDRYPESYCLDIEKAIKGLKELKAIKDVSTCGKCVRLGTDACPFSFADEDDTEICGEYLTEGEDG